MKNRINEKNLLHYEKIVNKCIKEAGINLDLSKPCQLTPKDLISGQQEFRLSARRLLSRYEENLKFPNSIESSATVQLSESQKSLTITAMISHENLYLPEVSYLLDYTTKKWFSVKLKLSSRQYEEKSETVKFGSSLSFSVSVLNYEIVELIELSEQEAQQSKNYFNYNWVVGQNPQYREINAFVDGEFRRNYVVNSSKPRLDQYIHHSEMFFHKTNEQAAA